MKKIILIAFFAIVATCSYAQGIVFFHGTFEEAKAKAKKENKKIFVDVYTSWCGPCKEMAKNVFPTKEVGDYFNANFVSMKLDAEKESSHDFFKTFRADGFPSFFWVDDQGVLMDMQTGSLSASAFVKVAKEASQKSIGNQMNALKKRWESGERNLRLANEYIHEALPIINPEAVYPTMIEYIKGLTAEELKTYEVYELYKGFCLPRDGSYEDDAITRAFFSNLKTYEQYENKYSVENQSLYVAFYRVFVRTNTATYLGKTPNDVSDKRVEEAIESIKKLNFEYKDLFIECIKAEQQLYTKNYEKAISMIDQIVIKYGEQMPSLRSQLLYSITMSGYCQEQNKPAMDKVLKLAADNLKTIPGKTALMYYATMQFAAGNFKEAYSAMAWENFYNGQSVSNAYFDNMNIDNIRKKFPVSTQAMESEMIRLKKMLKK